MKNTPLSAAEIDISNNGIVYSLQYGDIYFAPCNGVAESTFVFVNGCAITDNIPHMTNTHTVLELGFGTGLNFLCTLHAFATAGKSDLLYFISIEKHPIHADDIRRIYGFLPADLKPYADAVLRVYPPCVQGIHTVYVLGAKLTLYFDDIKSALPQICPPIHSIYLDGFAPSKNTAMWHPDILTQLYTLSAPTVRISTFTASSAIQKTLKSAGFFVHKRQGFGRKRESIIARKTLWHPPILPPQAKITIIGAGIMGCSLAHQLANMGYKITLYDQYPRPLMGTSGNPYALLMPKFNKNIPFHKNAFVYAHKYFSALNCIRGQGIIATPAAITDTKEYKCISQPHPQGILIRSGVIDTTHYAHIICAHKNIQFIQNSLNTIPDDCHMTVLCLGADTNTLTPHPLPYTINRGSVAVLQNPPQHMPCIPTYHKGYAYSDGTIGICGAHFERMGTWQKTLPPLNTNTHTKHIADKMRVFNVDIYNTAHTLKTGIRANTKNRIPIIHQASHKVFYIYGMGSRGYINAPYTAHLFCTHILQTTPHVDTEAMFNG